jgi:two-component system, LytTR family, sensor kinase
LDVPGAIVPDAPRPPPRPAASDSAPSAEGHWTRRRVFVLAWATYSAYKIVHLLVFLWVQPAPPSAATRVGMGLLDGAMVGICTLLLIAAGERFPVEKPDRARNVSVHVLLVFACSVTTLSMLYAAGRLLHPAELTESLVVFNILSITPSLFVFLSISATVQAVQYQRRYRTRELDALRLRAQLTAARLESLRAKLHPHFLFNTLNGISDLIFTDPAKADALVLRLAQLLRAALDTVADEIPVRQELEMLSAYFDIERMRFGTGCR